MEIPRLANLSVPAFRNFLLHAKAKMCKGNKFQKSSDDGNMSYPAPGSGDRFDGKRQLAEFHVMKTDT